MKLECDIDIFETLFDFLPGWMCAQVHGLIVYNLLQTITNNSKNIVSLKVGMALLNKLY